MTKNLFTGDPLICAMKWTMRYQSIYRGPHYIGPVVMDVDNPPYKRGTAWSLPDEFRQLQAIRESWKVKRETKV